MYYVVEEPDSLHSDRSPYDFEPADTHTSLSSQVADYTQSGYTQKNSGDFVIKEHSYTMCPGCPTFRYLHTSQRARKFKKVQAKKSREIK